MEKITYQSPFGKIRLAIMDDCLQRVWFEEFRQQNGTPLPSIKPQVQTDNIFLRFLDCYFSGRPITFPLERLDIESVTPFKRNVYLTLKDIDFGNTVSYGDVARMVGKPQAARAVGQAVATNSFPIFVPCHRVTRSDGQAGGFMAGKEWKKALLEHEKRGKQ